MAQREIKFRVSGYRVPKILDVLEIKFGTSSGTIAITPEGEFRLSDEGVRLYEFTGLKDNNSKEIYEGDVVKDNMGRIMRAGYHNLRPCWIAISATNFHHADFYDWSKWDNETDGYSHTVSVDVIGNMYENPELLEVS